MKRILNGFLSIIVCVMAGIIGLELLAAYVVSAYVWLDGFNSLWQHQQ